MKIIYLVIVTILIQSKVYSSQNKEVNDFCKSKEDIVACVKDYDGLPNLEELPSLTNEEPIPIKVIPFNKEDK